MLRWRLFLEDFGVQFHYIKGETNSLADALSRLPLAERQYPTENNLNDVSSSQVDSYFSMATDDDDLLDCFIHLPSSEATPFVLDYKIIRTSQAGDARLVVL